MMSSILTIVCLVLACVLYSGLGIILGGILSFCYKMIFKDFRKIKKYIFDFFIILCIAAVNMCLGEAISVIAGVDFVDAALSFSYKGSTVLLCVMGIFIAYEFFCASNHLCHVNYKMIVFPYIGENKEQNQ